MATYFKLWRRSSLFVTAFCCQVLASHFNEGKLVSFQTLPVRRRTHTFLVRSIRWASLSPHDFLLLPDSFSSFIMQCPTEWKAMLSFALVKSHNALGILLDCWQVFIEM